MNERIPEILGWYGFAAIFAAYALNAFGVLAIDGMVYHLLNLTGAVGIVLVSVRRRAYQPAALNIIWAAVATLAIARLMLR